MPRPLRIEYPGACYHVMSRGNARLPVLRQDADKALLLDRLVHYAGLFHVEIRAYCIMDNHVHMHVRTLEGNLGASMRSFLTSFTNSYNRRHDSCGHVFQGRYKAFLIEDTRQYRTKVTSYIHLNPARVSSLADAPLDVRHRAALDYPWGSYGQILGVRPCPGWLDRKSVLRGWGSSLAEQRRAYRDGIESQLRNETHEPETDAAARAVLGSERFVERMRRGLDDLKGNLDVRRESTQHRHLSSWLSLDDVINAVRKTYGTSRQALLRRHHRGCEGRQVLLYLAATHCRGRYSLAEIGQALGPISLAAVSNARIIMLRRMHRDPALGRRVGALSSTLTAKYGNVNLED